MQQQQYADRLARRNSAWLKLSNVEQILELEVQNLEFSVAWHLASGIKTCQVPSTETNPKAPVILHNGLSLRTQFGEK